jgi:hypothetical protein
MALKTIQAECSAAQAEVAKTIGAFLVEAKKINTNLQRFEKSWQQMEDATTQFTKFAISLQEEAYDLDSHGIVQLDQMKKLLMLAAAHGQPHPVKMDEIQQLQNSGLEQIKQGTEVRIRALADKRAAAWPDRLTSGMVFKKTSGGDLIEMVTVGNGATPHKVKKVGSFAKHVILDENLPTAALNPTEWHFLKT